jgi:hypothetical protein
MPRHAPVFECDISGISAPGETYDLDEATDLPVGWLEVTIRRVVRNPDFDTVWQQHEATRATALEAQAAEIGDDAQRRAIAESMVDRMLSEPEIAEYEVDERVYYVHPSQESTVMAAFGDADGLEA